jgi:hypothetical protein
MVYLMGIKEEKNWNNSMVFMGMRIVFVVFQIMLERFCFVIIEHRTLSIAFSIMCQFLMSQPKIA